MLDLESGKIESTDLSAAWILLDSCAVLELASSQISVNFRMHLEHGARITDVWRSSD